MSAETGHHDTNRFVAIANGAMDVSRLTTSSTEISIAVLSTLPTEPIVISNAVAELWQRLVHGPVQAGSLSPDEFLLVQEFVGAGIASTVPSDPARVTEVSAPWLGSYAHELVYGMVSSVAREHQIPAIAIKGPVLHDQGLRDREHSGDVDFWVSPRRVRDLVAVLAEWGWTETLSVFRDTDLAHSVTLVNGSWGCEIDLHYRFPGIGASDVDAFTALSSHVESRRFAGVTINVPTRGAHSVIHALHLVRPLASVRPTAAALAEAITALRLGGPEALDIAIAWEATGTLRDELASAFPKWDSGTACPVPPAWKWRTQPTTARAYLAAIRLVPWTRRPTVLRQLLWPERSAAAASAVRAGQTPRGSLRDRLRRLGRGFQQLRRTPAGTVATPSNATIDRAQFDHVIVTRFSVRFTEHQAPPSDSWLRERWRIFSLGTMASVQAQTTQHFTWHVFFDGSAPEWLRDVVAQSAPGVFTPVWIDSPWSHEHIRVNVEQETSAPWLITTRLDSDDLVAPYFVSTIHGQFAGQDLLYVNLLRGLQVDADGFVYRYDYPSNPFISLIERRTAASPRTVFASFRHSDSHKLADVHEVVTAPMWLQLVHGGNLSNGIRGLSSPTRAVPDPLREAASSVVNAPLRPAPRWSSAVRLLRLWVRSPGHARIHYEARTIVRQDAQDRRRRRNG